MTHTDLTRPRTSIAIASATVLVCGFAAMAVSRLIGG